MKPLCVALATCFFAAAVVPAVAQGDPLTGTVQDFFTFRPGGAQPPDARNYNGGFCGPMVARFGAERVWWGRFAGGRASSGSGSTGNDIYSTEGCFPNRGSCEAWLLDLKTEYNEAPVYNQCRAGYEPGAYLPPWWAPGR